MISPQTIERLILYRRILERMRQERVSYVYSHELAKEIGATAAQVRRDLMAVEYMAVAARGYQVDALLSAIALFLDEDTEQRALLVGVGHLGRALLSHFRYSRASLQVVAAFDQDPACIGEVIEGCPCLSMDELGAIAQYKQITIAVLTVPAAAAQEVGRRLVEAGVCGILNFAPVTLQVPDSVWVENIDVTRSLEKVAYYSRHGDVSASGTVKEKSPRKRNGN